MLIEYDENLITGKISFKYSKLNKCKSQPMTIGTKDGLFTIGLLDGHILQLNLESEAKSIPEIAYTHATLLATADLDLSDCTFDNKVDFNEQFGNYFYI